MPNPGAPPTSPAQPAPQRTSTAGMHPAIGTHVSSSGILDGGGRSSVTRSGGGQATEPSIFTCQKFGCDEKFPSGQERDDHQQGCEGLVKLAGEDNDLVETAQGPDSLMLHNTMLAHRGEKATPARVYKNNPYF